jgi:thiol-disulfide isomerase/thioredoxin
MLADLDVRFQTRLAEHFPAFLVNPTRALERSDAVESRLADLRGRSRFDSDRARQGRTAGTAAGGPAGLPVLGRAPEFADTQRWFNTGGKHLHLARLRGRVVLIDFWTYTCINCIRTLPYVKAWDERYRKQGLTVVGVHTPEFSFERNADNVAGAIRQNRLRYPVVQDNEYGTWTAYGNQFWPAKYLIDTKGRVRYTHFGEGDYGKTEKAIRALLEERREGPLGRQVRAHAETVSRDVQTPETYLGASRAEGFSPPAPILGTHRYPGGGEPPVNHFMLAGTWRIGREAATAVGDAQVSAHFVARRVFLVLSSRGGHARRARVLLDGKPIRQGQEGDDVSGGSIVVRRQRLYRIVSLPRVERRLLTLKLEAGLSGYAFTFG